MVGGNLVYLRIIRRDALEGKLFSHPLPQLGPFPLEYLVGVKLDVLVLQHSLKPGRYKDYLQWDSTRIFSTAYGNFGFLKFWDLGQPLWKA